MRTYSNFLIIKYFWIWKNSDFECSVNEQGRIFQKIDVNVIVNKYK